MPTLTIIRGLPGSGKTTLARALVAQSPRIVRHHEADMYHPETGITPQSLPNAHKRCLDYVMIDLITGFDVIVANTFVTQAEVEPYNVRLRANGMTDCLGHEIEVQIITCQGPWESIHDVPEETLARMRSRWEAVVIGPATAR